MSESTSCCAPSCCSDSNSAKAEKLAPASTPQPPSNLPIAIIGAGPVGLAAAAHCAQRGLPFVLLERGPSVGHTVEQWGHVTLFSPWRYNMDHTARALLESTGWKAPADDDSLPTGRDLVEGYLRPLAAHPAIAPFLLLNAKVASVGRKQMDKLRSADRDSQPFELRLENATRIEARAVLDASGSWFTPNPLGSSGYEVPGERKHAGKLAYGIPDVVGRDRARYAGQRVVVVGAGHSAITVVLELVELQKTAPETRIQWIMRRENLATVFGGEGADALPARGALGTDARKAIEAGAVQVVAPFQVAALIEEAKGLAVNGMLRGEAHTLWADQIVVCTGFRPDLKPLTEVRLKLDPALEAPEVLGPMIDPNEHSCGTVPPHGFVELSHPESNFYIVGMKSYGRAPTFLMATGFEQVRSVVAALAGDLEAARKVELDLPQTGVCRLDFAATSAASSCCA